MKFKRVFLFLLSVVLGIAVVVWLFTQIGIDKVVRVLIAFSWWHFLLVALISAVIIFLYLRKWKIISEPFQYKTSWRRLLTAFLGEQAISFITPIMYIGGEGVKAFILKENEEKKSFFRTFGLIIIDRLAEGCALLTFFLLGGIVLFFSRYFLFAAIMVFISLGILILIFIGFKMPSFFLFIIKILGFKKLLKDKEKTEEEINIIEEFLVSHRKLFILDILFSLFIIILSSIQIYLILFFLGKFTSVSEVYFIRVATLIAGLIPTPGSIGGFEGSIAFIFSVLGIPVQTGLALVLVMRGLQLIAIALGITLIFRHLTTNIFPTIFNNNITNNS